MASQIGKPPDSKPPMSAMKTASILVVVIGGAIGGLVLFLMYLAPDTGNTVVSGHGTVAMVLGVVFSLIVGIGLMTLVFYSSRRGYDDDAVVHRRATPREGSHSTAPGE